MAKLFHLEILTPERLFWEGEAEAVTITAPDGGMTVLAGHAQMVTPVAVGTLRIEQDGEWKEAFSSEGFMQVERSGVNIFTQACEWPYEIDEARALEAEHRAEEMLRQKRSVAEYKQSKIALARALARLRVTRGIHTKSQ